MNSEKTPRICKKISKNKEYFEPNSNIWKDTNAKNRIKKEEGPSAYDEAIDFLTKKAKSLEELVPSKSLNVCQRFFDRIPKRSCI